MNVWAGTQKLRNKSLYYCCSSPQTQEIQSLSCI